MKVSQIELSLCSSCINRGLCVPEDEFPRLSIIAEKFSHRDFLYAKNDELIFSAGDNADDVFCVYHGKVEVFNDQLTQTASDGDFIGFNSIIGGHYMNSAKAIESSFLCHLKLSEVQQLIKNHQPIVEKILAGY